MKRRSPHCPRCEHGRLFQERGTGDVWCLNCGYRESTSVNLTNRALGELAGAVAVPVFTEAPRARRYAYLDEGGERN
jgi:hypothetical protein